MMRLYLLLFLWLLLPAVSMAQDDDNVIEEEESSCAARLKYARQLYAMGKIVGLEDQLSDCFEKGFTKEEKVQAYKLLVLAALYDDYTEKVDKAFISLLKTDPEYKPNLADDPREFIQLFGKFRTDPVFSIGVKAGGNLSHVNVLNTFGVNNVEETPGEYGMLPGYQFGVTADVLIQGRWQASAELLLVQRRFLYESPLYDFSTLEMREGQTWLELPVALKYNLTDTRLRPYVSAGVAFNMLVGAQSEVVRTITQKEDVTGPRINTTDLRRNFLYSPFLNLGAKYMVGYGYFFVDARFNLGMLNSVDMEDRYSNGELLYRYGHIDDDYKLNNFTFSIGYARNFYKPKKLKRERWKTY